MTEYWMQTVDRGVFNFAKLDEAVGITTHTLAHSLSLIPRFAGHTTARWSVLHHTNGVETIVSSLVDDKLQFVAARPYVLLHDAHEAFTSDIPEPLKAYMKDHLGFDFKEKVEARIDQFLRKNFRLPEPRGWIVDLIKEADRYALKLERDTFMASSHEWEIDAIKIPIRVKWRSESRLPTGTIRRWYRASLEQSIKDLRLVAFR